MDDHRHQLSRSMAATPSKRARSMEDVWKDISLICPLPQDMPSTPSLPEGPHQRHLTSLHGGGGGGGGCCGTISPFSLRGIILQDFLSGSCRDRSSGSTNTTATATTTTIPLPPSHGHLISLDGAGDKDGAGTDRCCHDVSNADRRKKRLMKNRESAARSRARKQACAIELQKEVLQLRYENKMLKRQNDELKKAMADQVCLAKKRPLQRTLTTLF